MSRCGHTQIKIFVKQGTIMKHNIILILSLSLLLFVSSLASAVDFYGANIKMKDSNTLAIRAGVYGYNATVGNVEYGSPAIDIGLLRNDVILSINGVKITTLADLKNSKDGNVNLIILRGSEKIPLSFDGKKYNNDIINSNANNMAKPANTTHAEDLPPVYVNDTLLDAKYGKTTPAQRMREQERADAVYREDTRRRNEERSAREYANQQKLQNSSCSKSSDCGPGRACLVTQFRGQSVGQCMQEAEVDRRILENAANEAKYKNLKNEMDNLKNKTDKIEKNTNKYKTIYPSGSRSYPYGYIPPLP